jgi:signal peptidase I
MSRGKKKRGPVPPPGQEPPQPEREPAGDKPSSPAKPQGPHSRWRPSTALGAVIETGVIVVLALALAFALQAWVVKPYQIPSGSMEPTLDVGQRILVNRFVYHFGDPKIGDIIVFHPPAGSQGGPGEQCGVNRGTMEPCPKSTEQQASNSFVKRLVAGPGDTISVKEGHPVVNGVMATDEPFINPCPSCNLPKTITVPANHYFMMGDNRGASDDSREWGPIPRDWIIGKAFATYWPPNRIGGL